MNVGHLAHRLWS